jgi:hypothetical protein
MAMIIPGISPKMVLRLLGCVVKEHLCSNNLQEEHLVFSRVPHDVPKKYLQEVSLQHASFL